jgi:hypothetical protein
MAYEGDLNSGSYELFVTLLQWSESADAKSK